MLCGNAFILAMEKDDQENLVYIRRKLQHYRAMRELHNNGLYLWISKDLDVELKKANYQKGKKNNVECKHNNTLPLAKY
jgi:hypothetical protein